MQQPAKILTAQPSGAARRVAWRTESLFEAGARAAESTGAGLGLALARRVARTLGGDVTVTSSREPTSLTLTLPRP